MEKTILGALFLLPGFLSYIIVSTFKMGFGKKADALEKTLYSLLFNIPIFIGTLLILNESNFIKVIQHWSETYNGFKTMEEFQIVFSNQINLMAVLAAVSLFMAVVVALFWLVIIFFIETINNAFRKHKIAYYTNLWKTHIAFEKEMRPVTVYSLSDSIKVTEGFLDEVSTSLERDIELKISRQELFQDCLDQGIIGSVDYEYINVTKDIKIIFYSMDKINELYDEQREDNTNWIKRIITATTPQSIRGIRITKLVKEPLRRTVQRLTFYSKSLRTKINQVIKSRRSQKSR